MGKKRRRTSNQRDDTWTKGPEKPADAARRLKCARRFEDYYRQQLGLDDEEWRRMMATFRKPLPATFRVTAPDGLARKIERELREVCARCDAAAARMRSEGPTAADLERFSRDSEPAASAAAYHAFATAPLNLKSLDWIPNRRAWRWPLNDSHDEACFVVGVLRWRAM